MITQHNKLGKIQQENINMCNILASFKTTWISQNKSLFVFLMDIQVQDFFKLVCNIIR